MAERSTQATKRIAALIKTIQTETNDVVASMEDNTREVVSGSELGARARELAAIIASQPRLAIEGTVRAIWSTRSMPQREAVRLGYTYVAMGTNQDSITEGQKMFSSGKRVEWKLR